MFTEKQLIKISPARRFMSEQKHSIGGKQERGLNGMSFPSRKAKLILKLMVSLENTLLSLVVSYIVFSIISSLCSEAQVFSQIRKIQNFNVNVINHMMKHASAQLQVESNFHVVLIS